MLLGMVIFSLGVMLLFPWWAPHVVLAPIIEWLLPNGSTLRAALVSLITGGLLVAWGTRELIRAFTGIANPRVTGRQLWRALLNARTAPTRLRVVGFGGGTGLSTLLRGLKSYPVDLTAVVTVTDDGGSSGRLRAGLDMPPPGDVRNCLVALAETEPLMERLFQHRFTEGVGDLRGHTLGNLIIAGLQELTGDFHQAIEAVSRVLAVRGRVLPSANRALVLTATMEDGRIVQGETAIVAHAGRIVRLRVDPPDIHPLPEVLAAIRAADLIIVGPGSVYSSLLPNLLIPGVAEAIAASPAIKCFVCNVMTQPGESDAFSASRHLQVILEHLPCANPFDYAVVNLQQPHPQVAGFYADKGQHFVRPDLGHLRTLGTKPVTGALLAGAHLARHDPEKLAQCILAAVAEASNRPYLLRRDDDSPPRER
jgi:uncharacterized cofD-like protein